MPLARRRLLTTVPAVTAGALLGPRHGAAQGATRRVIHALGEAVVPASPQRVVAFDIAALDMLDALGVGRIVGVAGNSFPQHLARYGAAEYPKLGTLFEPNYEAVNAARPDLIIVGGRSAAKHAELARIAPTVGLHAGNEDYLARVATNTALLAGLFGREEQAAALSARLRRSAEALKAVTAGRGRGLIVLTTGTRMSAYGPGSRFGMIHTDLGVPAAVPGLAASLHGQAVNSEFILQTNPDRLFVVDRDAAIGRGGAARRALDNPLVRQTAAWRAGHVVFLDPSNWYVAPGGIQSSQLMVDEIAATYARA